jgi:A/G-specific adenine glycosylase
MLQQTTVAHARPYFEKFVARWPTVADLAAAQDGELMAAWAGLGYYARARNLLACARKVTEGLGGRFPSEEAALRKLPGIGDYTAAAIAAIAFDRPAVAVDANVERIVARLFAVEEALPAVRPRLKTLAAQLFPKHRTGEFTQAIMELGQTVCLPRVPDCARCPLISHCEAFASGESQRFPLKSARRDKPRRTGTAYWLECDGHVFLERRPARGLLGGMLALPEAPPADLNWRDAGAVDHVFTHFALNMKLRCAEAAADREAPADAVWWPIERIAEAGLPTLFAKLAQRGLEWRSAQ